MALTVVKTEVAGTVFPASDWNTYLRDNLNWLIQAGANLSAASTITPTNEFHLVVGTSTINNLTPSAPLAGQQVRLLTQSSITFSNSGGNVRTLTGTNYVTVAGETVRFVYDGTYWNLIGGRSTTFGFSSYFDLVSTSALTTIFQQSIPGGLLGPNGALRIGIEADYLNNSGATRNLKLHISFGGTALWGEDALSTDGVGAAHRAFYLDALLSNENATNEQRLAGFASLSDNTAATYGIGALSGYSDVFNGSIGGSSAEDSTIDTALTIQAGHSASNASLEFKGTVHVSYVP